jgi:hypothetical protein
MSIVVTPIPRLIDLAAPAFTLGTANAAGAAATAVASDATLLAFDTTVPSSIAYSASAAAGTAVVAGRRDHTHGMVAGPSGIYCRAYDDSATSCANNTIVVVGLNSERSDTDNMHDNTTNNSRITINTAGFYVCGASVSWASNTTGKREMWLMVNGSYLIGGIKISNPVTGGTEAATSSGHYFDEGDYIELKVRQGSGGSLNINSAAQESPELWATKTVG